MDFFSALPTRVLPHWRVVIVALHCTHCTYHRDGQVREKIVENFRERMQLRRSLIELEDQNVQNSIEVRERLRCPLVPA